MGYLIPGERILKFKHPATKHAISHCSQTATRMHAGEYKRWVKWWTYHSDFASCPITLVLQQMWPTTL